MVFVIKFDGRKEEFQKEKIIRTCLRVGVSDEDARAIAGRIESSVKDGMTTQEIYQNILKELRIVEKKSAVAYSVREMIAHIDPEIFELFVKKLLEAYGYQCEYSKLVEGLCVEHQVDIIAKKDGDDLVECKRHSNPHRFCGLGTCLQVQARLEDIRDGFASGKNKENFRSAWIITNTKFSEHAKRYAQAKQIMLTGWNFPYEASFASMIDEKKFYPVSALSAKKPVICALFSHSLVTIHDISEKSLAEAGIEQKAAKSLLDQKKKLLG